MTKAAAKRKARLNLQRRLCAHTLSRAAYQKLARQQHYCCAICGRGELQLAIDHDHQTGMVRGLLCRKCNSLLGFCQDTILVLENARRYLLRFQEPDKAKEEREREIENAMYYLYQQQALETWQFLRSLTKLPDDLLEMNPT